jgi:hypothetical protein
MAGQGVAEDAEILFETRKQLEELIPKNADAKSHRSILSWRIF